MASFFTTPDGEAALYDIATGQRIGVPFPSLGPNGAASLSPDGSTLLSGDGTGLFAWDVDLTHWRDLACTAAGRNLTHEEWAQYLPADEPYRATCPQYPS